MKRAFTLVELIVVIAILAAVLFPAFDRTHCSSRVASCQSNEKQIGLAFLQYTQDYNDCLPPVAYRSVGWANLLQPYAKSWSIFNCPSTPMNTPPATDYFFNGRLARFPVTRVVSPEKTLLLGEGGDARSPGVELRSLPPIALENKKSPAWRHIETGANYLFSDGHVKFIKPEDFDAKVKWNPRYLSP